MLLVLLWACASACPGPQLCCCLLPLCATAAAPRAPALRSLPCCCMEWTSAAAAFSADPRCSRRWSLQRTRTGASGGDREAAGACEAMAQFVCGGDYAAAQAGLRKLACSALQGFAMPARGRPTALPRRMRIPWARPRVAGLHGACLLPFARRRAPNTSLPVSSCSVI